MPRRIPAALRWALLVALVGAVVISIGQSWVAAAPSAGGWTQTQWGPLGPADRDLLQKVRLAGLWEAPTGQQAQQQATSPAVKEVGGHLAGEHAQLDIADRETADKLGVLLPSRPSDQQLGWMNQLSGLTGSDYDRTFVQLVRAAHGTVLPLIAQVRAGTRNELMRQFADTAEQYVGRHIGYLESTGLVDYSALPAPPEPAPAPGTSGAGLIVPALVVLGALLASIGLLTTLRRRPRPRPAGAGRPRARPAAPSAAGARGAGDPPGAPRGSRHREERTRNGHRRRADPVRGRAGARPPVRTRPVGRAGQRATGPRARPPTPTRPRHRPPPARRRPPPRHHHLELNPMATTSRSRRRLFVAAAVSATVFVLGPAAYGVAATTVDKSPSASSTQQESPDQDDGGGTDGQGGDDGGGGGQDKAGGSSDAAGGDSGSDDGAAGGGSGGQERMKAEEGVDGSGGKGDSDGKDEGKPGLDVLATDCSSSKLAPHDGFQKAPRCVSTAFGEVAAQAESPSLLITDAPKTVAKGQTFQIEVSTRNLVRDRFLGAAAGGYYKETSLLTADGLQRGHFHTACRMLPSTDEAPDASPEPAFFKATEDKKGGATPDTVSIEVPGVDTAGELQCSAWAGDGSHRIPMMQRADQTPAFDSVRVDVS